MIVHLGRMKPLNENVVAGVDTDEVMSVLLHPRLVALRQDPGATAEQYLAAYAEVAAGKPFQQVAEGEGEASLDADDDRGTGKSIG